MNIPRARLWVALTAVGALALGGVAQPVAAGGSTRWVDNDGRAGPAGCGASVATYKKIQAAIAAAVQGDTIVVCPGTYTQNLQISGTGKDGMHLIASTAGNATIRAPQAGGGVPLLGIDGADDVVVRGLNFVAPTTAPCRKVSGLILVESAGVALDRVHLAPGGSHTAGVCGYQIGIDVGGGAGVTIDRVTVRDFQLSGVYVHDVGTTAFVRDSTIRFVHAAAGKLGLPPNNSGIYGRDGATLTIRRNTISGRSTAGQSTPSLGTGIKVYASGTSPVIAKNTIDYAFYSIAVTADGGTIANNSIHHGRRIGTDKSVGLSLSGGTNLEVSGNTIAGHDRGIRVDGGAQGHQIHDNDFHPNAIRDCYDDTTGAGTAGTDNTWTNNIGNTALPAGICLHS